MTVVLIEPHNSRLVLQPELLALPQDGQACFKLVACAALERLDPCSHAHCENPQVALIELNSVNRQGPNDGDQWRRCRKLHRIALLTAEGNWRGGDLLGLHLTVAADLSNRARRELLRARLVGNE